MPKGPKGRKGAKGGGWPRSPMGGEGNRRRAEGCRRGATRAQGTPPFPRRPCWGRELDVLRQFRACCGYSPRHPGMRPTTCPGRAGEPPLGTVLRQLRACCGCSPRQPRDAQNIALVEQASFPQERCCGNRSRVAATPRATPGHQKHTTSRAGKPPESCRRLWARVPMSASSGAGSC